MNTPKDGLDELERRVRSVPLRGLPSAWRAEILDAACGGREPVREAGVREELWVWVREWLWPRPAAWGALAAVWLVVGLLQVLSVDKRAAGYEPRVLARGWAEQRRELATMLMVEPSEGPSAPGPRSERSRTNRNV